MYLFHGHAPLVLHGKSFSVWCSVYRNVWILHVGTSDIFMSTFYRHAPCLPFTHYSGTFVHGILFFFSDSICMTI